MICLAMRQRVRDKVLGGVFLIVAVLPSYLDALSCFLCEGNALTCENSNIQQMCTGPEIYCRLDVNSAAYPYIRQTCSPTCIETVSLDGIAYTYCARTNLGNCYRQQCNGISLSHATTYDARQTSTLLIALASVFTITLLKF